MNGKRREIPVTPPEMLLQSLYFYRFLPNRPFPLSSFDTHARWQPVRRAISRRFHGKIGDSQQPRSIGDCP